MTIEVECQHKDVEYEAGNHVPPYGWEIYPGYYCLDCGQRMDDEEVEWHEPDPDLARKYELELEMENSL